jgi:hypothetical protein
MISIFHLTMTGNIFYHKTRDVWDQFWSRSLVRASRVHGFLDSDPDPVKKKHFQTRTRWALLPGPKHKNLPEPGWHEDQRFTLLWSKGKMSKIQETPASPSPSLIDPRLQPHFCFRHFLLSTKVGFTIVLSNY